MQAAAGPAGVPGPGPEDELAPAGLCLRPDPGSRLLGGGSVLAGGSPVRVLRLTPSGARHVAGWWSGTPVPDNRKARALARRLLDTGIAHPVPGDSPWGPADVTVVIPVRDRQAELTRCLAGLSGGLGGIVPPGQHRRRCRGSSWSTTVRSIRPRQRGSCPAREPGSCAAP